MKKEVGYLHALQEETLDKMKLNLCIVILEKQAEVHNSQNKSKKNMHISRNNCVSYYEIRLFCFCHFFFAFFLFFLVEEPQFH